MKRSLLIILLFGCYMLTAYAQTNRVFYGSRGPITDSTKAKLYMMINRVSDTIWEVKQYGMDNILLSTGTYKDKDLTTPNGHFVYYALAHSSVLTTDKKIKEIAPGVIQYIKTTGEYNNGMKNGRWIEYSPGGGKQTVNTYKNDFQNGKYESYVNDTTISVTGNYIDDMREGDWYVLSMQGHVIRKETYEHNKVINRIVTPPAYISAIPPEKYDDFLRKNVAKLLTGTPTTDLSVECTITKEGRLTKVTVKPLSRDVLGQEMREKIADQLTNCPLLWKPPFDTAKHEVVEDTIAFNLSISNGSVRIIYFPIASALIYQQMH